jgi:hypothetical protein
MLGAAPPGLDSIFLLPTLHGFAGARLQGGLNDSAPAALGSRRIRQAEGCATNAKGIGFSGQVLVELPEAVWCDKNRRDPKISLDFARDFACGAQTPARRLNFDSAPISEVSYRIAVALRSGRQGGGASTRSLRPTRALARTRARLTAVGMTSNLWERFKLYY